MRRLWERLMAAVGDEWPIAGMAAVVVAYGVYWFAPAVAEGVAGGIAQEWRSYWQRRAAIQALHEDEQKTASTPAKPQPSSSFPLQTAQGQTAPNELNIELPPPADQLNINQIPKDELVPPKPAQTVDPTDFKQPAEDVGDFTYEDVPPFFTAPDLEKLFERYKGGIIIHINSRTAPNDALVQIRVKKFQTSSDWISPYDPNRTVEQGRKVHAILFQIAGTNPWLLQCYYRVWTSGGRSTEVFFYWFKTRPDLAEPAFLNAISSGNPVARIGVPRTACPNSMSNALIAGGKVFNLREFEGPP